MSYDGDNLRQSETTTPSGGSAVTEYFTWNPEAATPELLIDSTNAYVYGIDSTPIEQVSLSTGAVKYLVADALGSVRGVVNGSSGSLTGTTAYDAWGNPETSGGLLVYTPFGYAGGYTDSTGLSYFINRYYDPETGQFLTVDPMVTETGQPYAYAYDDPVDLSDVSGECAGLLGGSNQTLAAESVSLASGACIAFHYYRRHHLSPNAAAGIVGNLLQESQMEPYAGQGTAHQGIAQWSPARWGKLVRTANREQKNPWGRWFQITYVLNEMRTSFYSTVYGVLKNPSVSLDRATTVVFEYYEAPGDNSLSTRISYAREVKRVCS